MFTAIVLLTSLTLFDTLRSDSTEHPHVRSWFYRHDYFIESVRAFPTSDPHRLLVKTWEPLVPGATTDTYITDWTSAAHMPIPQGVVALSADRSRYLLGARDGQRGVVAVLDGDSHAHLFAVPSFEHGTTGSGSWPWLSADGRSAVFTLWNGTAPLAPGGEIAAMEGIVVWEQDAAGLRLIGEAGAIVLGASDHLDVLIVLTLDGRVVATDQNGTEVHELCAAPEAQPQTCRFRGLSPDGRHAAVLDEGIEPARRVLVDLFAGTESPMSQRGSEGYSWVAFDPQSTRMLYSRCAGGQYQLVVRMLSDAREFPLDTGVTFYPFEPRGFVADHFAVVSDADSTTFIDTRVISMDGFDAYDGATYPTPGCPRT